MQCKLEHKGGSKVVFSPEFQNLPARKEVLWSVKYPDQFFLSTAYEYVFEQCADSLERQNLKNAWNKLWLDLEGEKDFNDENREEITDRVQAIPGFQEFDEDVETWMACDAEDCGLQMLNDDEIVTSVEEVCDPATMKRMKTRTTTATNVARVHEMLTRFLR
ncbi:UNVERIFIED_CONTAM: hypothetical protein NCL1_21401 [Trichonephila clavipes]